MRNLTLDVLASAIFDPAAGLAVDMGPLIEPNGSELGSYAEMGPLIEPHG